MLQQTTSDWKVVYLVYDILNGTERQPREEQHSQLVSHTRKKKQKNRKKYVNRHVLITFKSWISTGRFTFKWRQHLYMYNLLHTHVGKRKESKS